MSFSFWSVSYLSLPLSMTHVSVFFHCEPHCFFIFISHVFSFLSFLIPNCIHALLDSLLDFSYSFISVLFNSLFTDFSLVPFRSLISFRARDFKRALKLSYSYHIVKYLYTLSTKESVFLFTTLSSLAGLLRMCNRLADKPPGLGASLRRRSGGRHDDGRHVGRCY